jgi:hypothetical protein
MVPMILTMSHMRLVMLRLQMGKATEKQKTATLKVPSSISTMTRPEMTKSHCILLSGNPWRMTLQQGHSIDGPNSLRHNILPNLPGHSTMPAPQAEPLSTRKAHTAKMPSLIPVLEAALQRHQETRSPCHQQCHHCLERSPTLSSKPLRLATPKTDI